MTDNTAEQVSPVRLLRAALARANVFGAREIRFSEGGVSFKDALGESRPVLRNGSTFKASLPAIKEAVGSREFMNYSYSRSPHEEISVSGQGTWIVTDAEDGIVLKAKKAKAPCVDALVHVEGNGLARLRSLYRDGGFDLFVLCEGDTRARDLALAFAAERNMLGLPTETSLLPEPERAWGWGQADEVPQDGPELFDPTAAEPGEPWSIQQIESRSVSSMLASPGDAYGARVFVAASKPYEIRRFGAAQAHLDKLERPAVVACVTMEKSRPVMRLLFSSSLEARSSAEEVFVDAPWIVYADRKADRLKSRPPVPKTWHPTTEAVAVAFLDRQAPRGYVSGRSLYFHGPVAFSTYDQNPVAALVDLPGKKTAIFYGRDGGIGGTLAGTVSMAQGDIQAAARDRKVLKFHVDRLTDFIELGNSRLDEVAMRFRRDKNEAEFPSTCRIDRNKLRAWFSAKLEECQAELDKAMKTDFATYTKAGAYRSLQHLAEMRDSLAELLNARLPDMGNADEYRVWAETENQGAQARQAELARRREQQREEENSELRGLSI